MANYALICPTTINVDGNPGRQFIVDGIRWFVRSLDPAAQFQLVDLMTDDLSGWQCIAKQCDVMLLCGNPRFNLDARGVYCDLGIWDRILTAMDAGVSLIDGWAGAAHPFPVTHVETMADHIAQLEKTRRILSYESRAVLCIARDAVTQQLFQSANCKTVLWPCCSWYAANYHQVSAAKKDFHCITLERMPGYGWIIDRALELKRDLERELPTYVIAHSWEDFQWIASRRRVSNLLCLHDPESLIRFYARVDKLLTFRLHAAIVALSVGCRVCNLSIDSRSLALDEFGIPSVPFLDLQESSFAPTFHSCARTPRIKLMLDGLKSALQVIGERRNG